MRRSRREPRQAIGSEVLEKASERLAKMERMPRWLSQTLAVVVLLLISTLFINGGTLLAASFMHVLIDKVDMPPSLVYHTPAVSQPAALPPHPAKAPAQPETKGAGVREQSENIPSSATSATSSAAYLTIPRPTLAKAMDQTLIRLHNPADAYIQSDAVDAGILLEQSLHDALVSVFSDATRTSQNPSPTPPGIPLTQGQ